jgi:hypothetical protein
MATWKKVIVSGSNASLNQLNVGTNQQIGTTQATTYLTGSFTGSFIGDGANLTGVTATAIFPTTLLTPVTSTTQVFINDGANKYVTVGQITGSAYAGVSGDITINSSGVSAIGSGKVTSAMIVDATIVDGDIASATITNAKLANSTISGIALGSNLAALTLGAGLNGTTYNGGTATVASVASGSMASYFTSASWAGVTGDILINGSGVATIQANSVSISADVSGLGASVATALGNTVGSAGSVLVNGGVLGTPSGGTLTNVSGLPISGLVSSTSTALGVGSLELGHATDTSITRVSAGVAAIEGNNIITANNFGTGVATFLATPSSANLASALTDETGTAGSVVFSAGPTFTGTANFAALSTSGNVTIGGNLNVAGVVSGSATYITSTNVAITDQFVLLASGSSAVVDAGIIVQDAVGTGEAFYWENNVTGTSRWAIASGVAPTAVTVTAAEYMVSVATAATAPSAAPTYGGATNGFGQMYVNSSTSDIYIYA